MKYRLLIAIIFAVSALAVAQNSSKTPTPKGNRKLKSEDSMSTTKQKMKTKYPSQPSTQSQKATAQEASKPVMMKSEMTFNDFKAKFNKTYETKEAEVEAERNFISTKAKVDSHNSQPKRKYVQGVNSMADISQEKFYKSKLGLSPKKSNDTKSSEDSKKMKKFQRNHTNTLTAGYKQSMPDSLDLTRLLFILFM
jgi:Cathepsin propeptide inhibitor domain (I29)